MGPRLPRANPLGPPRPTYRTCCTHFFPEFSSKSRPGATPGTFLCRFPRAPRPRPPFPRGNGPSGKFGNRAQRPPSHGAPAGHRLGHPPPHPCRGFQREKSGGAAVVGPSQRKKCHFGGDLPASTRPFSDGQIWVKNCDPRAKKGLGSDGPARILWQRLGQLPNHSHGVWPGPKTRFEPDLCQGFGRSFIAGLASAGRSCRIPILGSRV